MEADAQAYNYLLTKLETLQMDLRATEITHENPQVQREVW